MKSFIDIFCCDLKRSFFSVTFFACSIGLSLIYFISIAEELTHNFDGRMDVTYFRTVALSTSLPGMYLLLAAIPGTTMFHTDIDTGLFRFSIMRVSQKAYLVSKIVSAFITALAIVFLGEMIFYFILHIRFPFLIVTPEGFYSDNIFSAQSPFHIFASEYKAIIYFGIIAIIKGTCAGLFSILAMIISVKFKSLFIVFSTPVIAYFVIIRILAIFPFPKEVQIYYVENAKMIIFNNTTLTILYSLFYFISLSAVMGILFYRIAKRRIENE